MTPGFWGLENSGIVPPRVADTWPPAAYYRVPDGWRLPQGGGGRGLERGGCTSY